MPKKGRRETKADPGTTRIGRDAKSGEFVSITKAKRSPSTTTVERVPKPGRGDTKKK
jgi:hypothetical protein